MPDWTILKSSSAFCFVFLLSIGTVAASEKVNLQWRPPTGVATGPGVKGPWKQSESNYDYVDDASIELTKSGDAAIVWVNQKEKDIFFQMHFSKDGKATAKFLNLSKSPDTFSWLPRILISKDKSENIFVLWQEIIFSGGSHGGDIFFASSSNRGKSFSKPLNLSNSIGGDGKGRINKDSWQNGSLDLALDEQGKLFAVWTEYDGFLWLAHSEDQGRSFSKPLKITGSKTHPARGPALAVGAGSELYLAWTSGENDSADIQVVKSKDSGLTFSPPVVVAKTKGYSDAPDLAVDSKSVLNLVFAESSGGPFDKFQIRYTRSRDGGQSFEKSQEISKPGLDSVESAQFPEIALDAKNRIFIKWEIYPNHKERPKGLGYTVSLDAGESFSKPDIIPHSLDPDGGSNGSHQGLLMKKISVNEAGSVGIANSSLKPGEKSRVWFLRGEIRAR